MKQLQIVIFQPEIPHNAGAAIRLCAGMAAELHFIRPLGFTISDKHLERVALGYHTVLQPILHRNLDAFLDSLAPTVALYRLSSKGDRSLATLQAGDNVALLFGSETRGLHGSEKTMRRLAQRSEEFKILQMPQFRCHNLSNSIAMAAYEVQRQWGFPSLL